MTNMRHLLWIAVALLVIAAGCKKTDKMSLAVLTTASPGSITANSAQLGGNITNNGGSNISKRGTAYAAHSGPTVSDSTTSDGTGTGTFTSTLPNLMSNTTYYAKAYAINADGTAYGDEQSFVTSKGLATVTTTAVTGIAPLVAYSGGNVVNDGGASVTARGICWSTSPHPTITNFKTSDSTGAGVFTDSLVNLQGSTVYYVRAYATNSFGTAYGNEISFTSNSATTLTDIDGNVYGTIVIGTQTWMTSNLRTSHYQNGDPITNGLNNFDWYTNANSMLYAGAYTFPNGDSANNGVYGKLYAPYVSDDSRGVCPSGWHVPNIGDWETLFFYEGMSASDTVAIYSGIMGTNDVTGSKLLTGGSSGLNLQLAGYMNVTSTSTDFGKSFTQQGYYLTSGGQNYGSLFYFYLEFDSHGPNTGYISQLFPNNGAPISIRCLKN